MLRLNPVWKCSTRHCVGLVKGIRKTSTHKCGSHQHHLQISSLMMCSIIGVAAFLMLQCAEGSPASSFTQDLPRSQTPQFLPTPSPPKFSSRIVSTSTPAVAGPTQQQTHKRSAFPFPTLSSSSPKARPKSQFDFSHGFPDGFTQGLPKFDFSKPMDAQDAGSDQGEPVSEDTKNVGFVHGPPEGFPTLEQLGGKFPSFQSSSSDGLQSPQIQYPQKQDSSIHSFQHGQEYKKHQKKPYYDDAYLSGPGPASPVNGRPPPPPPPHAKQGYKHGIIRGAVVGVSSKPYHYEKRPPQGRPQESASSNSGVLKYIPGFSRKPLQIPKPSFMKMGGTGSKKFKPSPPGPPVFYAPSPDILATSSQRVNSYKALQPRLESERLQRFSRSTSAELKAEEASKKSSKVFIHENEDGNQDDLIADGSEPGSYWQLAPSPFIVFDTYDHAHSTGRGRDTLHERADVISSRHSNVSEPLDEPLSGEQRFFPSFPAPSPYLGLGGVPFGLPAARPPLFPGPAANRAPSRYYPQFGPSKYTPSLGPPPNRGPSNVFSSAESHDHYQDNNLLGSGNFEVVRGGTYYQEDDGLDYYHQHGHDHDGDYYQHHNGHSAPHGYRVPGQDFFANFRDFADINPPSRSFSHNHETKVDPSSGNTKQPKNILEKLQSTSESVVPAGHHEFSSSSEQDPMIATF